MSISMRALISTAILALSAGHATAAVTPPAAGTFAALGITSYVKAAPTSTANLAACGNIVGDKTDGTFLYPAAGSPFTLYLGGRKSGGKPTNTYISMSSIKFYKDAAMTIPATVPASRIIGTPPTTTSAGVPANYYIAIANQAEQTSTTGVTMLVPVGPGSGSVKATMAPIDASTFMLNAIVKTNITVSGVPVACTWTVLFNMLKSN